MKRMAVLCLLLLCARAAWAEDFSAYEIKTHGFPIFAPSVIMDNGDLLFHTWDDRAGTIGEDHPWHLEWMRDGNVYRDFPYTNDDSCSWNASSFMPIGDECYVIVPNSSQKSGEGANGSMLEVYRWTDAGMERIAAIEDCAAGDIAVLRGAFAVWKRESGTMQINRYEGTPLQTYQLKPENQMIQVLEAEDGTLYALIVDYRNADWAYTVYALKDGAVLWQREYQDYVGMKCPGDGYLYILKQEGEGDYKAIQIERLDAEGNAGDEPNAVRRQARAFLRHDGSSGKRAADAFWKRRCGFAQPIQRICYGTGSGYAGNIGRCPSILLQEGLQLFGLPDA